MTGPAAAGRTRLALLLGAGCAIAAGQAIAPFDCVGTVCGFNVLARELRVAPCQGQSMLVAYSAASGLSLVQCSTPGDAAGNGGVLDCWLQASTLAQVGRGAETSAVP